MLCYRNSFASTHFIQVLQKAKATFFQDKKVNNIVFINRPQHSYERWNLFWKVISQRAAVTGGVLFSFRWKRNQLPSVWLLLRSSHVPGVSSCVDLKRESYPVLTEPRVGYPGQHKLLWTQKGIWSLYVGLLLNSDSAILKGITADAKIFFLEELRRQTERGWGRVGEKQRSEKGTVGFSGKRQSLIKKIPLRNMCHS